MNIELLVIFIVLNAINVIIQTIKSLCTINCGKFVASVANAVAYGFYTVVVIYMICDLPLMWKVLVVGACNFIGVFLVKFVEEKMRKEKLWKVEATIPSAEFGSMLEVCSVMDIPYNYIDINKYYLFNFYCATQKDSAIVKSLLDKHNAKYFVSESKNL